MSIRAAISALFIAGAVALTGCSDTNDAADTTQRATDEVTNQLNPNAIEGEVEVDAQTANGRSIVIEEVELEETDGFVAIHRDDNGQPGAVVGHAFVAKGHHEDVRVTLDENPTTGTYWAMLHVDAGQPGTYEFPGADAPLVDGGDVAQESFVLTAG